MWKMVIGLCAAMYGLALLVGPAEKTEQAEVVLETPAPVLTSKFKPVQRPDVIRASFNASNAAPVATQSTANAKIIVETALDAPAEPKRPAVVMRDISFIAPMPAQVRAPVAEIAPEIVEAREETTVVVTARSVNLRAGPSTGHGVLGSLKRGTQAVLVDDLGNGWSKISVPESNLRGFIASKFLSEI